MREVHLLHGRRKVAHMQNDRALWPHDEGWLLDGIVADRDDQIGAVYCPMHIVPLRKRGSAHVEPGSTGDRTLAHLRVEERDLQALHEIGQSVSQVRTACSRT